MKHNLNPSFTVIMTTFDNSDFTLASLHSLALVSSCRVILADGGSCQEEMDKLLCKIRYSDTIHRNLHVQTLILPDSSTEDCRNAASALVDTPFILFMDNDVRVLEQKAIDMLLELLTHHAALAAAGAYGVKVVSWDPPIAYVGTEFTSPMEVDASPCYFTLHRTEHFRAVGGFPKECFYPSLAGQYSGPGIRAYTGDLTISKKYAEGGIKTFVPGERVPVIHWGGANQWFEQNRANEKSWHETVRHIRCNPLNQWVAQEQWRKEGAKE
jgi:hypothetical protein